jgi:hypothetical protein
LTADILHLDSLEANSADTTGLVLPANTDEKRMLPRRFCRMKHLDRARAGGDHGAVGKADPPILVLTKELIAHGPIRRLVFAPIRVDLASDLRGQLVGNGIHRYLLKDG